MRQVPFEFARSYVHNGESTARLQNQLWLVSMCLRKWILPPTVRNLHLPTCISKTSQDSIKFGILKKMKRGLRVELEAAKTKLLELKTVLTERYAGDAEELQRGRDLVFNTTYRQESEKHRRKLQRLSEGSRPATRSQPNNNTGTTTSSRITDKTNELSSEEKDLLSRGPKFALATAINEDTKETCQTAFARFAYQYRWGVTRERNRGDFSSSEAGLPSFPRSSDINLPPTDTETEIKLRRIYHSLTTIVERLPARKKWSNLPREEARALQTLRSKAIALMPSDKGGEFCAVGLETYKSLGQAHLADTTTYQTVPRMTAKTIETKINRTWKDICRERSIPPRSERSFVAGRTRLATFHHVIKTHKQGEDLKIRPIVASRGSPTEKITWLLSTILSPLLKEVPTHMPDSDHLMEAITSTAPQVRSQHRHQCSLDVESLYTSIPVSEALSAVQDKLRDGRAIPTPLRTEDVIQLMKTVFELTYFHFEGKVYRQIAGLPMGCAVSGIVAILFMETIERRALAQFARCILFKRYVDDCYALVRNAEEARQLQACLNGQHPSIKFQLENCEPDQDATSLSLLDLTVRISASGETSFNFYTKKAKSNIFMHKESALPWSQKAAAIRNEQKRIASRSGGEDRQINQVAFLEKLQANGYRDEDISRVNPARRRRRRNRAHQDGTTHYIDLPFLGDGTERKIKRAFAREGINIRIYRRSTTILDVVRPKQPEIRKCKWTTCPTKEAAKCFVQNCVYQITCSPCGRRYVGSTTRPLHERIREHTTQGRGSTIHEHLVSCGGGAARVEVKIVAKEKDEVNTRLREAITIKKLRPELNTQEESDLVNSVF